MGFPCVYILLALFSVIFTSSIMRPQKIALLILSIFSCQLDILGIGFIIKPQSPLHAKMLDGDNRSRFLLVETGFFYR